MLLDKNYNLKLADFGFATMSKGKYGQGLLYTDLGTDGHKAPEIMDGRSYRGS